MFTNHSPLILLTCDTFGTYGDVSEKIGNANCQKLLLYFYFLVRPTPAKPKEEPKAPEDPISDGMYPSTCHIIPCVIRQKAYQGSHLLFNLITVCSLVHTLSQQYLNMSFYFDWVRLSSISCYCTLIRMKWVRTHVSDCSKRVFPKCLVLLKTRQLYSNLQHHIMTAPLHQPRLKTMT